ncbi:MAG: hypothetical protein KC900_14345 [Candidatus Omnitrophica bacterium]|nr:hypothetical protein [Candidatus Omnitrophota bacterium]
MKTLMGITLLALIIGLAAPSFAFFGLPETVEGTVEEVDEDILAVHTVKGNTEKIIQILLGPETEYTDIAAADELKPGDVVQIKYKEKDGDRIAVSVTKIAAKVSRELKI